jgi:hypothetical protein
MCLPRTAEQMVKATPCTNALVRGGRAVGSSHQPRTNVHNIVHACLFGYLPLTMLLLRALNACISFLLLILLGSRQFALCICVPSGLACSICAPPCYTAVSNLCSSVSLLHASGVLLQFPVTVLKCTFGFAFRPVAVYTMILCSCRPL